MKPGVRDFHRFVKEKFKEQVLARYKKHKILTEADLQAYAFEFLCKFFRRNDPTRKRFKVLNKPFFKEIGIHPDIAVFKREKPWVLFEIKERRDLPERVARKERERLIKARKTLDAPPKRAYLLYAIRYGRKKVLRGPKAEGARYFFEIPIVLQLHWPIEKWFCQPDLAHFDALIWPTPSC
jgi:hypothetical protein